MKVRILKDTSNTDLNFNDNNQFNDSFSKPKKSKTKYSINYYRVKTLFKNRNNALKKVTLV